VASGADPRAYGEVFTGFSFCLSKALGAPVGSMVVGDRDVIDECRAWRHRLGGAMRQVGVLAAAGRYVLAHHVDRLADDHANARLIAEVIADVAPDAVDPTEVETNIVYVDTGDVEVADLLGASRRRASWPGRWGRTCCAWSPTSTSTRRAAAERPRSSPASCPPERSPTVRS
jgi:threonine aldolase